jgi:DNA processing protein
LTHIQESLKLVIEEEQMINATEKKCAWLRLIRSTNIGPLTFWELLRLYGTAEKVLEAVPQLAARGGRRIEVCGQAQAEEELESHTRQGIHLLLADDPLFSPLLKTLPDCPPVLSVKGQLSFLAQPTLAIVGARNASLNGCRFTQRIAQELSQQGWIIVSGLARGIDRHAHEGALAQGTIAVLAGGVDRIYPPEHEKLYQDISTQGLICSEMPLGVFPGATHFPRRNRLISGLARGVIIIEAALKSGTMVTARFANEQNRDVFAVPGSPLDPRCRGTNHLIKEGAYLIESADDILKLLGQPRIPIQPAESPLASFIETSEINLDRDHLRTAILADLDSVPLPLDLLVRKHAVPSGQLMLALIELELAGCIRRLPQQTVMRLHEEKR